MILTAEWTQPTTRIPATVLAGCDARRKVAKMAYDLQRCYNWRCPAMTGIIRGIDRLEGVDNV